MENNIINGIIQKQEVLTRSTEDKIHIIQDTKHLLPVVISPKELALIEIRKEFSKVKKHHSLKAIAKFLVKMVVLFAKLIRWTFLASSRLVGFIAVSVIIIASTTLITKNIINAQCGAEERRDESKYSIYELKNEMK